LDFVNKYDELANGIFGEAIYSKGIYSNTTLEPQDFQSYDFDRETGLYVHEGKNYSLEWPIFERLVEKKKEHNQLKPVQQELGTNRY